MTEKWYSQTAAQVLQVLRVDPEKGLKRRDVKARRQKHGENDVFSSPQQSYFAYLSHFLADIPTVLLFLTVVIAIIFEDRITLAVALGILVLYLFGATAGYVRAQKVLDGIGDRTLPNAKVLREGKLFLIKQKHLVPGDIIFLSGGDVVPCDARLLETDNLEVLETNLFSRAHTVRKHAESVMQGEVSPAEQRNMVFASTIVMFGRAKAVVCEIGADTILCKTGKDQPAVTQEDLPILSTLKRISQIWSICMMVTIFLLTGINLLLSGSGRDLLNAFLTALSLSVSSMSEYYMPFGFLIVACGIWSAIRGYRGMHSGVMIKNIGRLDTMRRVNCLVVPLEGVFTAQDFRVKAIYSNGKVYETSHKDYQQNAERMVRIALLSTGLYGAETLKKNNSSGNNVYSPEEEAIIHAAEDLNLYHTELERTYPMLDHRRVGSLNPLETTIVRHGNENLSAVRGGIHEILPRCTGYCIDGKVYPMNAEVQNELILAAASLTKRSCRVVAIASGMTDCDRIVHPANVQKDLILEGLLAIREPILPEVAFHLQKCRENGIEVYLLADDENESHVSFARALGVIETEEEALTSAQMSAMKEGIFRININRYRLYMGLNPGQKQLLLRGLRDDGRIVGFLAHDLSEIGLYQSADVGFAQNMLASKDSSTLGTDMMSRSVPIFNRGERNRIGHCEALKHAADVIISEASALGAGGFNAIMHTLITAKGIFRNLHRAIAYLMTTQTVRLLLVMATMLTGKTYLTPTQILFSGLTVDFLGVLMIAFSPSSYTVLSDPVPDQQKEAHTGRLLVSHLFGVLPGLLLAAICIALPPVLQLAGDALTGDQIATAVFYTLVLAQWMILLCSGIPHAVGRAPIRINRMTVFAFLIEGGVCALCIFSSFGRWLDCVWLPSAAYIGIAGIVLILFCLYMVYHMLVRNSKSKDNGGIYEREAK